MSSQCNNRASWCDDANVSYFPVLVNYDSCSIIIVHFRKDDVWKLSGACNMGKANGVDRGYRRAIVLGAYVRTLQYTALLLYTKLGVSQS